MIYTGYYANMKKMPASDEGKYTLISISRGNPSWMGDYIKVDLHELKPSWEMVELAKNNNYEKFVEMYREKLSHVNIGDLMKKIPDESILLCYEGPDKFCHRHIVRNWLEEYGYLCNEIKF